MKVKTIQMPVLVPDFDAEIEKGIDLLDEKFGEQWVWWVDEELLDLSDATTCVLGQIFREKFVNGLVDQMGGDEFYGAVKYLFNNDTEKACKYGFNISTTNADWGRWCREMQKHYPELDSYEIEIKANKEAWDALTRDWIHEIKFLRKERKTLKKVADKIVKHNTSSNSDYTKVA